MDEPKAFFVFINCPYQEHYEDLFQALVFTIFAAGFRARTAIEDTGGERNRLDRIADLIRECQLGIHDLSLGPENQVAEPHLNMAFELGLFMGHRKYTRLGRPKRILILDTQPYRHWKTLSDLGGFDGDAHGGDPPELIRVVRNWLQRQLQIVNFPDGDEIHRLFKEYQRDHPHMIRLLSRPTRTFDEFCFMVSGWLQERVAIDASQPSTARLP
jgi:hypothetical protein